MGIISGSGGIGNILKNMKTDEFMMPGVIRKVRQ